MSLTRRYFLQWSAAVSSGALAARTTLLHADDQATSNSPNEKLGFAMIGVRGQGNGHINTLKRRDDVEILYICDVDEEVGRRRAEEVGEWQERKPEYVQDFRRALEDDSVDCISTATPNHWHALVSIWSMQAGKDVYVEKPASHNVWEGRQMVNWARHLEQICQCGTQCRSSSSLRTAVEFVRSGELGPIQYVIGTCYKPRKSIGRLDSPLQIADTIDYDLWCGPAAKVDLYRPQLHYDWHWDFNTGNGDMGNQGIHQMDIARWFLGVDHLSPRILSIGGRLGYEDAGNTPNTQVVYHDYADAPLIFETRGLPRDRASQEGDAWDNNMDNYRGSQIGVVVQCEKGYVVIPSYTNATAFDNDGEVIQNWEGGGNHHGNFIDAVRSRNHADLNADILDGHLSSGLCHTGAISHQLGQLASGTEIANLVADNPLLKDSYDRMAEHLRRNEVEIDGAAVTLGPWLEMDPARESFINNDAANALLTREYREGFVVPQLGWR
jgi:predicted dehydrogenase